MLESRSASCFKVSQLSQESTQLDQDDEDFRVVWAILADEAFQTLVELIDGVVLELLQDLPVLGQLVLRDWVVEDTEDFDRGDEVLQS